MTPTDTSRTASSAIDRTSPIDGLPVKEIENSAFANAGYVNVISIPSSVTRIGQYAFGSDFRVRQVYCFRPQ